MKLTFSGIELPTRRRWKHPPRRKAYKCPNGHSAKFQPNRKNIYCSSCRREWEVQGTGRRAGENQTPLQRLMAARKKKAYWKKVMGDD